MAAASEWQVALVAATALHAGFQLTVTCLVYPALASSPPDSWESAHQAHSRRITPVVGVVYLVVVVGSTGALLSGPAPAIWCSAGASALVLAITAFLAAPAHGRLGGGYDRTVLYQLLRVDRWRSVGAVVALAAALASVLG